MAWTDPRTWNVGEVVTKAIMDAAIKFNFRYLHGDDGPVSLNDALILPDGAGKYLHIPVLTTTQRDALTPTAGMLVYNSSTTQFNKYENGAWRADLGFNSDHGGLSGMGDDDHTQYALRSILTTRGDIIYRNATVWARLAKGALGQVLTMGADDPQWGSPVVPPGTVIYHGCQPGSPPTGWLLCDGTAVSRTTYADLFTAISTRFGVGDNSTTFNVPNLVAKFAQGIATAATDPGAAGGAVNKTTSGHTHSLEGTSGYNASYQNNGEKTGGNTGSNTDTIGDIRPPYLELTPLIKT